MKKNSQLVSSLVAGLLLVAIGCERAPTVSETPEVDSADAATASLDSEPVHAEWLVSYEEALAKSEETGKPILADFTGSDWCGWCIKLHDEVFSKDEFASWAGDNVILLELDYPRRTAQDADIKAQNAALKTKYEIRGYPTILFLDSNGDVLGDYGYDKGGPSNWTSEASKIISSAS